jgi:hypothetical protein
MKVPEPERRFTRGPEIAPVRQLLEWLDRHARGPSAALRVRLPICLVLERGARIKSARIGVGADEDGLEIRLGDSPMGISLQDRVQASRPAGPVVRAWLEGIWHGTGADGDQFTVFRLHQVIPGDAAAAADHVQVEVSDGSSAGRGERRPGSEPT